MEADDRGQVASTERPPRDPQPVSTASTPEDVFGDVLTTEPVPHPEKGGAHPEPGGNGGEQNGQGDGEEGGESAPEPGPDFVKAKVCNLNQNEA